MSTIRFYAGTKNVRRHTFTAGDFEVEVNVTLWGYTREDSRKARVYVSGEQDVDFTEAHDANRAAGFPARGTNVELDKTFDRLNRQVVANQKAVITEASEAIPELAAILGDAKLTFNRKAGCSCGCSPAFIPSRALSTDISYREFRGNLALGRSVRVRDIFITKKS